ncbi:MAG: YggT family protein [Clostridia bacterium]|nr:YggT family protein [Clostridia bacterium]
METIFYFLAKCVQILLDIVSLSMMVRAIMPIFADVEESGFYALTVAITEPFVAPVRFLFAKLNIGQDTPIDMAFFATYIILWVLGIFLPVI